MRLFLQPHGFEWAYLFFDTRKGRNMSKLSIKRRRFIVTSLVIPVILLVAFVVFPAIDLFRMSFTDWDGYSAGSHFIWFDNYKSMVLNGDFLCFFLFLFTG